MRDVIELIENVVATYPNRIAIIQGDRKITYREFYKLTTSIANFLESKKEKPLIAFDILQSIEAYALIIASMKIGGTFCPLNPHAPIEKKQNILSQLNSDFFIIQNKNDSSNFEKLSTNIFTIDECLVLHEEKNARTYNYSPEDLIYIIFTSGSTGDSKGVMIYRKGLNKFVEWSIPAYGANETDIWAQYSLLSFDLSIVDIFTCLCSGSTLFVINSISLKLRPSSVIEKNKITIWHSVPTAIDLMIKNETSKHYDISSLRLMSFCGEPLRLHHLEFLFSKNNKIKIFNTYGPTEGTLFCTVQELSISNYKKYCYTSVSIGKPIPGWSFLYSKNEGTDEKEITIYGDYIGKGYLKNIDEDKFGMVEVNEMKYRSFKTGDLVIEKNGNLYFSRRLDGQVKINGNRIELGEIDHWLIKITSKNCRTIMFDNSLYSFIESEDEINQVELKERLSEKLESYKIPNSIRSLKEFPKNENFKVNTKELIKHIT